MIHATTELAIRKLLDENQDQILKAGVDDNGRYILLMTNKLQCQYNRLMKNMKETLTAEEIIYRRIAATSVRTTPPTNASRA